jgi:signal transduction histidine kinase
MNEVPRQRAEPGILDSTLSKFLKRAVVAQTVLVLAAVWGYAGWWLRTDREQTLEAGGQQIRTISAGLQAHVQAILNEGVGSAVAASNDIKERGGLDAASDIELAELLRRHLTGGEYVRGLFVAAPGRFASVSRDEPAVFGTSWPGWLKSGTRDEAGEAYVGHLVELRDGFGRQVVPVAKRVDEKADIWVGALLGVASLDELYRHMHFENGVLGVFVRNRDVLIRVPPAPPQSTNPEVIARRAEFIRQQSAVRDEALVEGDGPFTGARIVFYTRRIVGYPLLVSASRAKESILESWRARTRKVLIGLSGISLVLIGLAFLLRNFASRVEGARLQLQSMNADLERRVRERTAELQDANAQLAITNQELEAFTASTSHDLRSPLGSIAGQAGMLREDLGTQLTPAVSRRLDRIADGVKRCADIIDGLLSLAKVSRQGLLSEPIDMTALIYSVVEELRQHYPAHGVRAAIPEGVTLQADPRLIESLFSNLLDNAWKYTAKTTDPAVEIKVEPHEGLLTLSVSDNGAGFDMAHATHIFEPFRRMHSAAEFPGIGVGLATVARIVQRYGGRIWVDSAPGKGTTFRFTLPGAALCQETIRSRKEANG